MDAIKQTAARFTENSMVLTFSKLKGEKKQMIEEECAHRKPVNPLNQEPCKISGFHGSK